MMYSPCWRGTVKFDRKQHTRTVRHSNTSVIGLHMLTTLVISWIWVIYMVMACFYNESMSDKRWEVNNRGVTEMKIKSIVIHFPAPLTH